MDACVGRGGCVRVNGRLEHELKWFGREHTGVRDDGGTGRVDVGGMVVMLIIGRLCIVV